MFSETESMRFRQAIVADVVELAQLRWDWRTTEDPDREKHEDRDSFVERFAQFARDGLDAQWTVWVAEDAGRIVSNIWVYRVPKVPSPGRGSRDFGYMTNVYTRPEARDRGIGAELLAAVTDWAHARELEMLIVWPSDRSVSWYRRGGFAPSAEVHELNVAGYEG